MGIQCRVRTRFRFCPVALRPVHGQAPFLLYIQTCERGLRSMRQIRGQRRGVSEDQRLMPSGQYPSGNGRVRPERLPLTVRGFPPLPYGEIRGQKRNCFSQLRKYFFNRSSTGPQQVRCAGKNGPQTAGDFPSTIWRNQGPKTELFFSTAKIFFSASPAPDHNRSDAPERTVRKQPGTSPSTIWRNQGPKTEPFFSGEKIFLGRWFCGGMG